MIKPDLVTRILDGISGLRKEGNAYLVSEETDLSIYIGLQAEVLTLVRVARVTLTADLLSVETFKGDRFYFPPDLVVGVKAAAAEGRSHGRGSGAGFR
jgi:hypothetical protein